MSLNHRIAVGFPGVVVGVALACGVPGPRHGAAVGPAPTDAGTRPVVVDERGFDAGSTRAGSDAPVIRIVARDGAPPPAEEDIVASPTVEAVTAPPPVEDVATAPSVAVVRERLGFRFVLIRAGAFLMGSPEDEPGRNPEESRHEVTLTRAFEMTVTEVTRGQYAELVGADPGTPEGMMWFAAAEFANLVSRAAGLAECYACTGEERQASCGLAAGIRTPYDCVGYRMPTEAEWEYAARAGTDTAFFNGPIVHAVRIENEGCGPDPGLALIGWYCDNAQDSPHPVAELAPNAWGLFDMSGNVAEWTTDRDGAYAEGAAVDPWANSGFNRITRGGNWYGDARSCRSAARQSVPPYIDSSFNGIRLVRTVEDPDRW
jgi:formylglycine-generating enzyme required for sulfatase activity